MLVRRIARNRCLELSQRIRRGTHLRILRRWFGVLGVAVQRAVVQAMLDGASADLPQDMLEPIVRIGDLPEQ